MRTFVHMCQRIDSFLRVKELQLIDSALILKKYFK
jgi:hypothetical protein